jgi:alpha-beta hydrolase superfamily lysophospholipase
MTLLDQHASVASWTEPEGLSPRGTLIVIPGRGESPEVYERFGRRIASDAYRVHVVTDPVADAARAEEQIRSALDGPQPAVLPVVLAGSDTGALFAAGLAASGRLPEADALILAGLPTATGTAGTEPAATEPAGTGPAGTGSSGDSWDRELEDRTACPTHRGRLAGAALRRGALYEPVPDGWAELSDLRAVTLPILGLHGADDPVSPLSAVRGRYAAASHAELVSIAGGRHDALNDITHRTVAATVILFLERLRAGAQLPPIAVLESL